MCPGWDQTSAADWTVMTIMQWFNDVGVSSGTSTSDILEEIEDDKIPLVISAQYLCLSVYFILVAGIKPCHL